MNRRENERQGGIVRVRSDESWPRANLFPGSEVRLVLDSSVDEADLYGGVNALEPGAEIPLHYHETGEFQYVLAGHGLAIDSTGLRLSVGPGDVVFSRPGLRGAHGFRNTGGERLMILFLYPTPGTAPSVQLIQGGSKEAG